MDKRMNIKLILTIIFMIIKMNKSFLFLNVLVVIIMLFLSCSKNNDDDFDSIDISNTLFTKITSEVLYDNAIIDDIKKNADAFLVFVDPHDDLFKISTNKNLSFTKRLQASANLLYSNKNNPKLLNDLISVCEELLDLCENNYDRHCVYNLIGNSYDFLNQIDKSLEWTQKLIESCETSNEKAAYFDALYQAGISYYCVSNDFDKFVYYLKKSISNAPNKSTSDYAYGVLVETYYMENLTNEANEIAEKYFEAVDKNNQPHQYERILKNYNNFKK